ncbi:MAG: ECF transporter S component [Lawsonibacter sp.]|nr:ECF transporter S component [Lawsonibacter sp.]
MSNPAAISKSKPAISIRAITITAMLSAVACVLNIFDFPIPFLIPAFVKMDVSDLPELLAAFSLGPWYGVTVTFLKNLLKLVIKGTSTAYAGELCNFILGASFSFVAGAVYHVKKSRKNALIGALAGAAVMALLSIPCNYYISYPVYTKFMAIDKIIAAYQAIRPGVNGLLECLIVFNAPFTLLKGLLTSALCFLIYKPLSPVLHGTGR